MKNTKFYRGYVVAYDRFAGETYETACCRNAPHTSWQAAESCARRALPLYGGTLVTKEVPGAERGRRSL